MFSFRSNFLAAVALVSLSIPSLLGAEPTAPSANAEAAPAKAVVRLGAEYFYFTRESEFLGQDRISDLVDERLEGNLAGIGLTIAPLNKGYSFEFYGRAGELEAEPRYRTSTGIDNTTRATVTRQDFEAGVRIADPGANFSFRIGAYYFAEDLENLITDSRVSGWSSGTFGRDPSNPKRYTRSLSVIGGYLGFGLSLDHVSKRGVRYGMRIDADFRIGALESDFVLTTSSGEEAEALYGIPHRVTFYVSAPAGPADLFFELGAKGEYNFTDGAGVKGYDYGAFARLGFSWRF